MSRHVTSRHVMPLMSCHVMTRHVTSRHVTSRHFMSCHVTSRHVTSRHVMSCHVMSCHGMAWHGMAWHVIYHITLHRIASLRIASHRLFHAAGQATANARGPMVTVFVAGMNRFPDRTERRCDRSAIEQTGIQYFDRKEGADPWMHRHARTHSLKRTRSEMSSQWSWRRMASDT